MSTEGDKVITINDGKIKTGIVKNIYPELCTALVLFEDGELEKVSIKDMAKAPEPFKDEPEELAEITITPDEFRAVGSQVVADLMTRLTPDIMIPGATILAELHEAIFSVKNND